MLPTSFSAFLAEVSSSLDSEAISSLTELAAVLHILAVIKHGEVSGLEYLLLMLNKKFNTVHFKNAFYLLSVGISKVGMKNAAVSVQQQLHKHALSSVDGSNIQR